MRFFPTASCDTSTLPPPRSSSSGSSASSSSSSSSSSGTTEAIDSCPYLPPPQCRSVQMNPTDQESKKSSFFSVDISIGRGNGATTKHERTASQVDPEMMIFERLRDRMMSGPFAPVTPLASIQGGKPGSRDSLKALNALMDLSYSQGYYDASFLPPPYIVDDEPKSASHLSPSFVAFASHYPLVTIAGLGVLATTTFLSAAGLTALALKRLGAAGNVARKKAMDVRMDDLERRLVETLAAQSSSRTAQIADLRAEMLKAFAVRSAGSSAGGASLKSKTTVGGLGGGKAGSAEAPVASRVEEARLSQIITQAMESVMSTRSGAGLMAGATSTAGPELAEDKLNRITSLLEEIQRSLASSRDTPPQGLASAISGDSNVMSLSDIASAIRQLQDINTPKASDTSEIASKAAHQVGTPAETLVEEFEAAAQSTLSTSRRVHSTPTSPAAAAAATYDPNSAHQKEIRRRRDDAGTQAANQAHSERVDCTAHLSDAEKASRAKERGDMASRMKQEAEEHSKRMKELMAKTFKSGSGAPMAKAYQATRWEGMEGENPFSSESSSTPSANSLSGRKEGLSGSESAPRQPSSCPTSSSSPSTSPSGERTTAGAAPPPAPAMGKEKPGEQGYKVSKPSRASYGVDESGDWSFTVVNPARESGWKTVPIVLRRSQSSQVFDKGQMWTSWSGESSYAAYSTRARIFFYPEADMIEIDGCVWRCGREGGLYVIREKISEGEAKEEKEI